MNKNNPFYIRLEKLLTLLLNEDDFRTNGIIGACAGGLQMISSYFDEIYRESFIDTMETYGLDLLSELFCTKRTLDKQEKRKDIMEAFCQTAVVRKPDEIENALKEIDENCTFTSSGYEMTISGYSSAYGHSLDKICKFADKYVPAGIKVTLDGMPIDFSDWDSFDFTFNKFDSIDGTFAIYDTY